VKYGWYFYSVSSLAAISSCERSLQDLTLKKIFGHAIKPPKGFTPVVLLHYEVQHTQKDSTTITEAVETGDISRVISAAGDEPSSRIDEPLREALQTSKVTKNVVDFLSIVTVHR